jgi:hypothetical protein
MFSVSIFVDHDIVLTILPQKSKIKYLLIKRLNKRDI